MFWWMDSRVKGVGVLFMCRVGVCVCVACVYLRMCVVCVSGCVCVEGLKVKCVCVSLYVLSTLLH